MHRVPANCCVKWAVSSRVVDRSCWRRSHSSPLWKKHSPLLPSVMMAGQPPSSFKRTDLLLFIKHRTLPRFVDKIKKVLVVRAGMSLLFRVPPKKFVSSMIHRHRPYHRRLPVQLFHLPRVHQRHRWHRPIVSSRHLPMWLPPCVWPTMQQSQPVLSQKKDLW